MSFKCTVPVVSVYDSTGKLIHHEYIDGHYSIVFDFDSLQILKMRGSQIISWYDVPENAFVCAEIVGM